LPIFISYNHADKVFAENLATNLVRENLNVWIDRWELLAGDSLISKIQAALGGADAILVLLSKNSVKSEWCKKELNTGLIRELDEKSVLLIPIVLDDCEIPLFLREKLYIDFRKDKDEQFSILLDSLARISNPAQARVDIANWHVDWSMAAVDDGVNHGVEWYFVEHSEEREYVILVRVLFWPSGDSQKILQSFKNNEGKYVYSASVMKAVLDNEDFRLQLTSADPVVIQRKLIEPQTNKSVDIHIRAQRLGADIGFDTLVEVHNYFRMAVEHTLNSKRNSSPPK